MLQIKARRRPMVTASYVWIVDRDHQAGVPAVYADFADIDIDIDESQWRDLISERRPTWGPPEAPRDLLDVLIHARYNGWQWRLRGATPDCKLLYSGRIRFTDIACSPLDVSTQAAMSPLVEFGKENGARHLEYRIHSGWVGMV